MKEEKYNEAIKCYTEAMKLDSRNAVFLCNRYSVLEITLISIIVIVINI